MVFTGQLGAALSQLGNIELAFVPAVVLPPRTVLVIGQEDGPEPGVVLAGRLLVATATAAPARTWLVSAPDQPPETGSVLSSKPLVAIVAAFPPRAWLILAEWPVIDEGLVLHNQGGRMSSLEAPCPYAPHRVDVSERRHTRMDMGDGRRGRVDAGERRPQRPDTCTR